MTNVFIFEERNGRVRVFEFLSDTQNRTILRMDTQNTQYVGKGRVKRTTASLYNKVRVGDIILSRENVVLIFVVSRRFLFYSLPRRRY